MTDRPTWAHEHIGHFAPKLAELTDDLLFGDIRERPQPSTRHRSLVTVAAPIASYRPEQLASHMRRAVDNGVSVEELVEVVTHLAFYTGWSGAMTALRTARSLFDGQDGDGRRDPGKTAETATAG